MQNDFASDGGMFQRVGIDVSGIRDIVPAIARMVHVARCAGVLVCCLRMGFKPDRSDAGYSVAAVSVTTSGLVTTPPNSLQIQWYAGREQCVSGGLATQVMGMMGRSQP
jgi:nicotinamidase-related amidase